MTPILFALISYTCWGLGDILGVFATRKIGPYATTIWNGFFTAIFLFLFIPFNISSFNHLNQELVFIILINSAVGFLGAVFFYSSFKFENPSLAGTIAGAFGIVTTILSVIIFNERLTFFQTISIIIIFLGLIISTLNFSDLRQHKLVMGKGILFAFLTMLIFGIYFTISKIPVSRAGSYWPLLIDRLVFPVVFLYAKIGKEKINLFKSKSILGLIFLNAVFFGLAQLSYNFGISTGNVSIVAPIASSYPTLFVVLAFFIFKDKVTRQQIAGIITTLAGIVLLSIFSV